MKNKIYRSILSLIFLFYTTHVYSQEKCEEYYNVQLKGKESEKNDSEIINKSINKNGEYIISVLWKDKTKSDLVLLNNSISKKIYDYIELKDKIWIKKGFNYLGILRWESEEIFKIKTFKLCE